MGAEILRAVLDQSCSFSAAVFYTIEIPDFAAPGSRSVAFQCKQDRYFLCTGLGFGETLAATGWQDQTPGQLEIFVSRANRFIYNGGPVPNLLAGQDFNRQLTLPEYILIEPAETIVTNLTLPAGAPATLGYSVTLYGIEYAR